MTNIDGDRDVKIKDIERVDNYVYLGHKLKLCLDNQTTEVKRKDWHWMGRVRELRLVLKSEMNNSLRWKVFDSSVQPGLTYGSETFTLTKVSENQLRIAERE